MVGKVQFVFVRNLVLALVVSCSYSCSNDSTSPSEEVFWKPQDAPAGGRTLRAVWVSSSANVFAVGDSGTVLHYDAVLLVRLDPKRGFSLISAAILN